MGNKRIEWIDSTRGIAILLVVVGHVVGGYTGNYGMPKYQRIIDMVVDIIYTFHMPLFFMISGFVFGLKKYNWSKDNYATYINKKANGELPGSDHMKYKFFFCLIKGKFIKTEV